MKVLFAKCFGIGNCVMAVPALKAIRSIQSVERLDVLVGNTPDDVGALDVMRCLENDGIVNEVFQSPPVGSRYDRVIRSIPYDGRWGNLIGLCGDELERSLDGRTRPDPLTTGLVSWKRHEVLYQIDNAIALGWNDGCKGGLIPDTSFLPKSEPDERLIYFGIGYKKDAAGFWKQKHWGTENYAKLADLILSNRSSARIVMTGDRADFSLSIAPIIREMRSSKHADRLEYWSTPTLRHAFDVVALCGTYVGNDTGMMHVADSANRTTIGLFFMENSIVKSHPWSQPHNVIDGVGRQVTPEEVWEKIKEAKQWT